MHRIIKIGITGGIGSGKTYICNLFKKLRNVPIFNTDCQVKSDIILREHIKQQIIAKFGEDSYLSDGNINHDKFRKILFSDLKKKKLMDDIVGEELIPEINKWSAKQKSSYVLIECAIIFENGIDKFLDGVILVTCPKERRIERLIKRGIKLTDMDNVIRIQWSDEQKIRLADYVLVNDDLIQHRVQQLDDLLRIYAKSLESRKAEVL